MNTHTTTLTQTRSDLLSTMLAALIGVAIIAVVGLVQVPALHHAAHDVRHATGFPCH